MGELGLAVPFQLLHIGRIEVLCTGIPRDFREQRHGQRILNRGSTTLDRRTPRLVISIHRFPRKPFELCRLEAAGVAVITVPTHGDKTNPRLTHPDRKNTVGIVT